MNTTVTALAAENERLRLRVAQLESELRLLRTHPVFVQGLKGETLVAKLSKGQLTSFAASHDVFTKSEHKIEVKFSKLNTPTKSSTLRRWNWSKPLGWKDKGKDFDFLLLVGERDPAHLSQYPGDGPYVFFLIPKDQVPTILSSGAAIGSNVQINTNLSVVTTDTAKSLRSFIRSQEEIESIFSTAHAASQETPSK